ncbi:MAG: methyltransferase domain-containing protein [Patescibacteria group bacterium]|jgi:ubiquinone/menaquinone biosynthesis C-methylase UbiE
MSGSALLDARVILAAAQLRPGMQVADFGAGRTGHLVLPMAEILGDEGVVFAVDIHPEALSMLRGYRALREVPHLKVIRGDIERFGGIDGIEPQSLDRIFLVNTLWMTGQFASTVAEARRLLALDGVIVVVDWEPATRHGAAPAQSLRITPQNADAFFTEGGCKKCADFQPSRHHWGRIYSH